MNDYQIFLDFYEKLAVKKYYNVGDFLMVKGGGYGPYSRKFISIYRITRAEYPFFYLTTLFTIDENDKCVYKDVNASFKHYIGAFRERISFTIYDLANYPELFFTNVDMRVITGNVCI